MSAPSFDTQTGRSTVWQKIDRELEALIDPSTGKIYSHLVADVPCSVCGGRQSRPVFTKLGFDYVRCEQCTAIYVNPQLKPEVTLDYYRAGSQDKEERSSSAMWMDVLLSQSNQSWQKPYFEDAVGLIRPLVPSEKPRLLDMGCSIGLFMEVAQEMGFDCTGIELEAEARDYARSRNLTVHGETLAELDFEEETFDAVTLFGVLEHLQHPDEVLKDVYRCLKPGGVVMAVVPNLCSLAAMVLQSKSRMFIGRNHLTYFSWQTLPAIFERMGFMVRHLDTKLTALDSILNHFQFLDPQGTPTTQFLPPALQAMVSDGNNRAQVEKQIMDLGLGLRLRIVVQKPT